MRQHGQLVSLAQELSRTREELRVAHNLIRTLKLEILELKAEQGEQDDLPDDEPGE